MSLPDPMLFVALTAALTVLVTLLSLLFEKRLTPAEKKLFFILISVPVLLTTLYMAVYTVNHNMESVTGGPIHWHADFQVWSCGERLDLINPTGLKNKVGSPLFHEHDDDRIHVEGAVSELSDIDLGSFFHVVGGSLSDTAFTYPTDEGLVHVENGELCGSEPASVKVFVNGERISDAADFLYFPDAYVPPGDCIIVEFSPGDAQTTERICESWVAQDWSYDNYEELRAGSELPDYWPAEAR